jgi:thiol-disulfide isomerase/thioredoxin
LKKFNGIALFLVVMLTFAGCSNSKETGSHDGNSAGLTSAKKAEIAPGFELLTPEGATIKLSDYKGKVVILDFWDTWCPPCKMEIPAFIELQSTYGDLGLVIVGAAFARHGKDAVAEFVGGNNINYPTVIADRNIANSYGGIASIPTTFMIDKEGKIRAKHVGFTKKEVFESQIIVMLAE